jgi:hypothetical protein
MSRRARFLAPGRGSVPDSVWTHPAFRAIHPHLDLCRGSEWPSLAALNARWPATRQATWRFVAQDRNLLGDGLHYETRIFERGLIATRPACWHDLFNALVWLELTGLKAAINARQAADVVRVGPGVRTRAQCALTHFDEAGVVVLVRDPALLACWDRHDWVRLFWQQRERLVEGMQVAVVGHALLEHALVPRQLLVGKALVVAAQDAGMDAALEAVSAGIARGALLNDPQELRPLPLSGLPGWHPDNGDEAFHLGAPCYRPLRAGRRYPGATGAP